MTIRNTTNSWGAIAKSFHWIIALLILSQLVLGNIAEGYRLSPTKLDLFVWHKSIGVTVLLLVILRVVWRLTNPPPTPPDGIPAWETIAARIGHALLYLLMLAVPLSGWWVSDATRIPFKAFWLVPMPDLIAANRDISDLAADVHGALTKLLLLVVVIHIVAALRHHFFMHNKILSRMLPWRGETR